jgi:hypothetical protein
MAATGAGKERLLLKQQPIQDVALDVHQATLVMSVR